MLLWFLAACSPDPANPDPDGDGFAETDCGPDDAAVHPGAADDDCDGVDDDCDGAVDEAAPNARLWTVDADGDGWGTLRTLADGAFTPGCTAPEGYGAPEDCDDADPATHPEAPDDRCDGTDHDCDGAVNEDAPEAAAWYDDADGDGYGNVETEVVTCTGPAGTVADGTDCDDADPERFPGGPLGCTGWSAADTSAWGSVGTGVKDDLEWVTIRFARAAGSAQRNELLLAGDQVDAPLWVLAEAGAGHNDLATVAVGAYTGLTLADYSVGWAPDWDGDGERDLLANLNDASPCIVPQPAGMQDLPTPIACYAVDGPVAAPPADGADPGALAVGGTPARVIPAGAPGDDAGTQGVTIRVSGRPMAELNLAWGGDVDGDGIDDLYVVASLDGADDDAVLLLGPFDGPRTTADAEATLAADAAWPLDSAAPVADAGDVDGDGRSELLQLRGDGAARFVNVLSGETLATLTPAFTDDAPLSATSGATDLDADGYTDFVAVSSAASVLAEQAGALAIFRGPLAGALDTTDVDAMIRGGHPWDWFGYAWAPLGDWNGDAAPDLAAAYGPITDDATSDRILLVSPEE